ncbi:MAG: hypothetical protein O7E51_08710 [Acidobacteria bacterium]|nr:hypothetical protein [Acidobacteriota bacterium]
MTIRLPGGSLFFTAALFVVLAWSASDAAAQQRLGGHGSEGENMRLVGVHDLQSRSAYQPVILQQGNRWIAYVGLHEGDSFNPMTGAVEPNGTMIVDVTDPRNPQALSHIPGKQATTLRSGGAQMNRACTIEGKSYLLRSFGSSGHELWNVTSPSEPRFLSKVVDGVESIHKNWWECDTGIAYIISTDPDWRARGTKIFDLSNPEAPVLIRGFGLIGQEPGSQMENVPTDIHGPIVLDDRVYFGYGSSRGAIIQIVDRDKLLHGGAEPTPENLLYPQIGRIDMNPAWGGHTTFPVLGIEIPDFKDNLYGRVRDFIVMASESTQNECQEFRHAVFFIDITDPTKPTPVSTFQVPESEGEFCQRGGRFGPHATNESFTPIYYKRIVFVSYFNAGVRALDIRDPFHPTEIAHYIPATTANTDRRCVTIEGEERCKVAIQTNNVEVDDRGYIYIVDRANTGMHILELTGDARSIANFP